jgi:transposase/ribosomal protein L34
MEQSAPRVVEADRSQLELRPFDLDSTIPQDHRARLVWRAMETLDLSGFYERIKSRVDTAGRPPGDPKVFVALWLYATMDGVGAAREVERLCREHRAYRWICGGVPVNYHTLSDFRVDHGAALDELLTQILAVLMERKLVEVKRVAQDGLRVRASAGSGSFRRKKKLRQYLKEARAQVEAVKQLAADAALHARHKAARERAAREREERVQGALAALKEVERKRQVEYTGGGRKAKGEPRGSTTDPEARKMRMANGGFSPGYNVQLATDAAQGVIVGVSVTNNGSDSGQAPPMIEQIARRTGHKPHEYLADAAYADKKSVETLAEMDITFYGAVPVRAGKDDPFQPEMTDSAAVSAWRQRMGSKAGQAIYKDRSATSERVNADVRTYRTLDRMVVRGTAKVLCVALWNALALNFMRWFALAPIS